MNWIDKIQRAIDYIEAHLLDEITVDSVCGTVNYAPSSLQNLFSAVTGYSIGEYIRFRRLSRAADELADDTISVTGAAFKYGYETVEAFSKAFKRLFGYAPSKSAGNIFIRHKFSPIIINFKLQGGFGMARNIIPGLLKVDWSDNQRQSEYVNSVVSALTALGEKTDYDYVCAVSGSAFRTSFSMKSVQEWNFGNYYACYVPEIIEHTFKMLGYMVEVYKRGNYERDRRLIMDSIDKGVPVVTLAGVIQNSDACVISGYDNDGDVLLGYNPFMYIKDDHDEVPDDTGYFRKSDWHGGYFEGAKHLVNGSGRERIIIIGEKCKKRSKEEIFGETLNLIKHLIAEESVYPGQHNGLAAHKAFADALASYEWEDNFEPYMCVMCGYKQYLDRQYASKFFRDNGRNDLAEHYAKISALCRELGRLIPQDFSASDMFGDKEKLKPYRETLLRICGLEEEALSIIDKN